MTDYVWAPVSGDGQSAATAYIWNGAAANWNTGASWISASELLIDTSGIASGTVPGSGANNSQGAGQDTATLIAGELNPEAMAAYVQPGNPYFGSLSYPVDVQINSGTVDLASLTLAAFNDFISSTFPTLEIVGALLIIAGDVTSSSTAVFPDHAMPATGPNPLFGTMHAFGGGTIDIEAGATVDIGGAVPLGTLNGNFTRDIVVQFGSGDNVLRLDGVSSAEPLNFGGSIRGFVEGSVIDLPAIPYSAAPQLSYDPTSATGGDLTLGSPSTTFATIHFRGGVFDSTSFGLIPDATGGTEIVTCFAAGTNILTTHAYQPVETLQAGDFLPTLIGGGTAPIRWIGRRAVACWRHKRPEQVWPIRIAAHSFADGVPRRDLLLSPDHAVFVDGVLIPVKYLIDGESITQRPMRNIVYYHIELPRHDVVLAENLSVESYLDARNRCAFDNGGATITAWPDFASRSWEAAGCAPLIIAGPQLATIRQRLAARGGGGFGAIRPRAGATARRHR